MATIPSARPAWQRGAIFQFFASLKLAVVLLTVLIIASIAGTISESSFDARVARAYVYGAPWFNLWLILLAANLTVSALSRWPWRKHHVAFLITHLGIITLLAGSLIGRIYGIEGSITLFKDDPPGSRLLLDEHQLRVRDADGIIKGYGADFLNRPPTPAHPRELGSIAQNARLSIVAYAPALDGKLNPRSREEGGAPALHFTIATARMGQRLESWLLADDPQHGNFSMGLANIELKRGRGQIVPAKNPLPAPPATSPGITEIDESIFVIANAPPIARVAKGGSAGAKVNYAAPRDGGKGTLAIALDGGTTTIDVAQSLGKEVALDGTQLFARVSDYWPDFRIKDGKSEMLSDAPNNPAVVLTIHGRGLPVAAAPAAHGSGESAPENGAPPVLDPAEAAQNHLTLFVADDGTISYELKSRRSGASSGRLKSEEPLPTGWADWMLTIDRTIPHAEPWMDFAPAAADKNPGTAELPDGVRVRVQQGGETFEQWVPAGWQIAIPTSPKLVTVEYGWRTLQLPIALQLLDFEVTRNEGSDAPAGFKSTLRVTTPEGAGATGQCWMNHPFSFPGDWWRTWTGLTFKISQASWNPENLSQSTVQILRDPGWALKWIGSLLIVTGVFLMFYVKKFRRASTAKAAPVSKTKMPEAAMA